MSHQESNPKSRREVWLSVALAVARDGLSQPLTLTVHPDSLIVGLTLDSHSAVRDWCTALGFTADPPVDNGALWGFGNRDGWSWQIRCYRLESVVEPSPLAEEVTAAILADAEVSASTPLEVTR